MLLARTLTDLEPFTQGVVVPTMGALHAGHLDLIRLAAARASDLGAGVPVVVSLFVNPSQFDESADFDRYPSTLDADLAQADAAGADCVFAPSVELVYPPGESIPVGPIPSCAIGRGLEDAYRPGHFEGVCQVVRRLFVLTRCRSAVFGEKDWQQLQAARAQSRDEGLGVEIIAGPTVREPDGLALSSRNIHLTPNERKQALSLSQSLQSAGVQPTVADAERAMRQTMTDAGVDVNYAMVRDAESLLPLDPTTRPTDLQAPARAIVAGRLGLVRLLDNSPWPSE